MVNGIEALYRAHAGELTAFVRGRVRDEEIARDLVQTIFASLTARGVEDFNDPRQYLFRAARNQIAEYYRTSKTYEARKTEFGYIAPTPEPTPEDSSIDRDRLRRLGEIVDAMPKKQRQVFKLARFEEMTDVEIADKLGMKPAAVRQHVSRAMRYCVEKMRD